MLDSPLCIGGNSALPSANLLSLGIMQAGLPSALAKPQLCLWSFNCGLSVVIYLSICYYQTAILQCPVSRYLLGAFHVVHDRYFCVVTAKIACHVLKPNPVLKVFLINLYYFCRVYVNLK